MSARSFRSVFMVASCAGAALGCYLVSLRVASERASLEGVETQIVLAQRDIRVLQTEIGTRGRLAQLERWNASVLAMSAPSANQFLKGGFELAKLTQPERKVDFQAPVVLASAPAPKPQQPPIGEPDVDDGGAPAAVSMAPSQLLHEASLKTETREVPVQSVVAMPRPADVKSATKPATAAKPASVRNADKPGLAAAQSQSRNPADRKRAAIADKKSVDKLTLALSGPVTKPVRLAKTDPLAPLSGKHSTKSAKDTAPAR